VSKKAAERRHARRRAEERYGINAGPATRQEIARKIRGSKAKLIRRTSLNVAVYEVQLDDGPLVKVVWDRKRAEVVTFLPPDDRGERDGRSKER
jgi:hypothetical protein